MKLRKTIALSILLLFFLQLSATSYFADTEYLNVEQGLSNRFVNNIYQDTRGFIWICTNVGLNRYDGHSFKVFSKEKNGLYSDAFQFVLEDKLHHLWIMYREEYEQKYFRANEPHIVTGIDVLDPQTGKAQRLSEKYPALSVLNQRHISSVQAGNDHSIWISTQEGELFLFDGSLHLIHQNEDGSPILTGIGTEVTYWIVKTNQLQEIDRTGKIIKTLSLPLISESKMTLTQEGTLWVNLLCQLANNDFLARSYYQTKGDTLQLLKLAYTPGKVRYLEQTKLQQILPSSGGNIWSLNHHAAEKIALYDAKGNLLYHLPKDLYENANLKDFGYIHSVFLDASNLLWIATENGIIKINLYQPNPAFKPFLNGIKETSTRAIVPISNQKIWVNSLRGWGIVDISETTALNRSIAPLHQLSFDYTQGYGACYVNGAYLLIGAYGTNLFK
ncbi:MAG: hypothetical protein H7X99_06215, partial [Saprospiraceae bacterium]|nr:hypothetical protein [Saprospiraceae bacterium]